MNKIKKLFILIKNYRLYQNRYNRKTPVKTVLLRMKMAKLEEKR